MTSNIAIVLIILLAAVVLFVTERIRVDVVALMVLVSLVLSGQISPEEALSGFASPAVVTVWAVLILSASLARGGGRQKEWWKRHIYECKLFGLWGSRLFKPLVEVLEKQGGDVV